MAKPSVTTLTGELSSLPDAGKVLELEPGYCEICGENVGLWPPEKMTAHVYKKHIDTMWPGEIDMWETYLRDTDTLRRQNFLYQMQFRALLVTITRRADLYAKLTAAGAILPPVQA